MAIPASNGTADQRGPGPRGSAGAEYDSGGGVRLLVVSFGGLGLLPAVPGTWGTAGAAALAAAVLHLFPLVGNHWLEFSLGVVAVASVLTVLLTPGIERSAGKDAQVIVTDEVAGYFVTIALLQEPSFASLAAAFFVFRLFDIVKVWPANLLERLPSGWGVLLDDVMGGIYGAAIFVAVERYAG